MTEYVWDEERQQRVPVTQSPTPPNTNDAPPPPEDFQPPAFLQGDNEQTDLEEFTATEQQWNDAAPPAEPVAECAPPAAAKAGHNKPPSEGDIENMNDTARQQLIAFVERIERLEEEKKGIADDIKEVKAEAKGVGFDVKTIAKVLQRRRMDPDARAESDALLELYEGTINGD